MFGVVVAVSVGESVVESEESLRQPAKPAAARVLRYVRLEDIGPIFTRSEEILSGRQGIGVRSCRPNRVQIKAAVCNPDAYTSFASGKVPKHRFVVVVKAGISWVGLLFEDFDTFGHLLILFAVLEL